MDIWIWIGIALLAGLAAGAALAAWYFRRQRADAKAVSELQAELDEYKHEVTEHFVQTAELVNNMTRSYKAVYDHLEHGAYRLIGEETLRKELGYVDSEPVKLEYIGRRDRAAVLGPAASGGTGGDAERGGSAGREPASEPSRDDRATPPGRTGASDTGSTTLKDSGRYDGEQHDPQQHDPKQHRLDQNSDPASEEDTGPVR